MDRNTRITLLALRAIVEHERALKGTTAFDQNVWTMAYMALNKVGYLDKPIPAETVNGDA